MLEMQVKTMTTDTLDEYLADMASLDLDELYCSAEPLLSDDIWNKFELDSSCELSDFDDMFRDLDSAIPDEFVSSSFCEIRNHDCMWAGHCGSKEHPAVDEHKLLRVPKLEVLPAIAPGPEAPTPAVKQQQQPVAAGRSLLLKTVTKTMPTPAAPVAAATASGPSPDSPPISDDEDHKIQTATLKILNDAIDEFEIDEDSDLCEYFEEGEELLTDPVETPAPPAASSPANIARTYFNLQSDHCYHKDKNASMMQMAGLGIETPSDSEEEIDVVSIGEKQTFGLSRPCYALPTNPSTKDRQQLQRTMASAITNKRPMNKTVKQRSNSGNVSPKRRGIKRSRKVYKTSPIQSPYKKRPTPPSNSSDSEPELEKRSLHNNMERQRRIDLRNAFEELRVLIPQVNTKDRAAKVVILREAATYCDYLGDVSNGLNRKLIELRRQQERLRSRVSQLRRNLAAKR